MRKSQKSLAELFGSHVFSDAIMRVRLPKNVYRALHSNIEEGIVLDSATAEVIAAAMKDWAVELGATHFTHWFQPMNGQSAEKHDSFITPMEGGGVTLEFSGKELIKGESDASSFPSGGLRAVFEARGYTTWDIMSPAFVKEDDAGIITLCIPTAFCSYNGEALDHKTPLLRSMEALSREGVRLLHLLGHKEVKNIRPTVGAEQEYFLIDKEIYNKRRDLMYAGRTLFGARPPKGQEMSDRYYAAIKPRVSAFMADINEELWKLGVPAKTQHNEAAPAQHELAQIYTTANIACDHNQLTMEMLKKVADRHHLACLLHEKPFYHVSGSGKHNNWSVQTDKGVNLLHPHSRHPEDPVFWAFFLAVIGAVNEYAPLLYSSCATASNDCRLGETEAPPPILSVFIGDKLAELYDNMCTGQTMGRMVKSDMCLGISTMPSIRRDDTDRNRSSPFAFTGDKFEFRTPGSSLNIAEPNTVLNTTVAEMLSRISDRLERLPEEARPGAISGILTEMACNHRRILFNGNNFSSEWMEEAEKRGLFIAGSTVNAYGAMTTDAAIKLFEKFGVFSRAELEARYTVKLESYAKARRVEAYTMLEMARVEYIPAITKTIRHLAETAVHLEALKLPADLQRRQLEGLQQGLGQIYDCMEGLKQAMDTADQKGSPLETARLYGADAGTAMEALRRAVDNMENQVARHIWPVPTYGDLFYSV